MKKQKKQYGMSHEDTRKVLLSVGILVIIVVICLMLGMLGHLGEADGKEEVLAKLDDSNADLSEQMTEEIIEKTIEETSVSGETVPGDTREEMTAVTEQGTNYIYERVTWDEKEVAVLGDWEVDEEVLAQLNKQLKNYSGKISVKVVTIDGTKGLSYQSGGEYFMASAVKAPYLLYAYQQMEAGNGTPDEEMKYTGNFYHQGTGVLQYYPVGTMFTLETIMWNTMRESDNVGYDMCVARWGKEGYNELMRQLGCESFVMEDWTSWIHKGKVDELLIIWNEIYNFMNQGSEYSRLLYDSCTYYDGDKDYNFMKNALPGVTVSQKYGWSDDGYGDGAVIYGENQIYLVAIFMDSEGDGYDQQILTNVMRLINKLMDK